MGIISNELIRKNLGFAISNSETTLTVVFAKDSIGVTFTAMRQNIDAAFDVFEDGREETVDTRFYIDSMIRNINPSKGWILEDEHGIRYKVQSTQSDPSGVSIRLDCTAQFQR